MWGVTSMPSTTPKPYVRPISLAAKRDINAWWRSLTWVQKRRIMEIGSKLSPTILADNIEHMCAIARR